MARPEEERGGGSDSAAAGQSVGFRLPRYLNRPRHLTALHPGTFFFKPQLVPRQARCLICDSGCTYAEESAIFRPYLTIISVKKAKKNLNKILKIHFCT